ncbi:hypothetical protein MKW94_008157, partial [Papaver nudicaule]|nr:hypothetical protein [Papaver nudicaule]
MVPTGYGPVCSTRLVCRGQHKSECQAQKLDLVLGLGLLCGCRRRSLEEKKMITKCLPDSNEGSSEQETAEDALSSSSVDYCDNYSEEEGDEFYRTDGEYDDDSDSDSDSVGMNDSTATEEKNKEIVSSVADDQDGDA